MKDFGEMLESIKHIGNPHTGECSPDCPHPKHKKDDWNEDMERNEEINR